MGVFGLSDATIRKAERLVKHRRVSLEDTDNDRWWTFKVYGSEHQYECYLRFDREGGMHWSCNATNGEWGCVFSPNARHQPYCAHTLAAYLLLRREGIIEYDEADFLDWQDAISKGGRTNNEAADRIFLGQSHEARMQFVRRAGWHRGIGAYQNLYIPEGDQDAEYDKRTSPEPPQPPTTSRSVPSRSPARGVAPSHSKAT